MGDGLGPGRPRREPTDMVVPSARVGVNPTGKQTADTTCTSTRMRDGRPRVPTAPAVP